MRIPAPAAPELYCTNWVYIYRALSFFFFQAEDGIRDVAVTGVQTCALPISLEVRGTRNEESLEQVSAIELERLGQLARRYGILERRDVAPQVVKVEPDLLVAARHDRQRAERIAQHVQRLAERRPGVLHVELRPEEGEQSVAAVQATRSSGGQVGEQREAPGSGEEARDLASLGVGEVQGPEQPELDHARPLRR